MSLAKHFQKRARRNQGNAGWGRRAFLTLWLPRSAYPTPRPEIPAWISERLGTPDGWGGYRRDHCDGTVTMVRFADVHGGRDPREQPRNGAPAPLCVVAAYEDGERPRHHWTEVSARVGKAPAEGATFVADAQYDHTSSGWEWLADAVKARHDRTAWDETTRRLDWCSDAVQSEHGECTFWAKTTYLTSNAAEHGIIFAVKFNYTRQFSVHAARLFRALRDDGIRARFS